MVVSAAHPPALQPFKAPGCNAMSPTPTPPKGLFESILDNIWVSSLTVNKCHHRHLSEPLASWVLGPIPSLLHGFLCMGHLLELPVLLVTKHWRKKLISSENNFCPPTSLLGSEIPYLMFWSDSAGWDQKAWGRLSRSSFSTRSKHLCRIAVAGGRKSSNQQLLLQQQQQLQRRAPSSQLNLNLPSRHHLNLKSPHLSQTTNRDPHQAPQCQWGQTLPQVPRISQHQNISPSPPAVPPGRRLPICLTWTASLPLPQTLWSSTTCNPGPWDQTLAPECNKSTDRRPDQLKSIEMIRDQHRLSILSVRLSARLPTYDFGTQAFSAKVPRRTLAKC